jgi:hypothetical protein
MRFLCFIVEKATYSPIPWPIFIRIYCITSQKTVIFPSATLILYCNNWILTNLLKNNNRLQVFHDCMFFTKNIQILAFVTASFLYVHVCKVDILNSDISCIKLSYRNYACALLLYLRFSIFLILFSELYLHSKKHTYWHTNNFHAVLLSTFKYPY